MNRIKKINVFFLLAIITCCIIFIPQLISGQSEDNLLNKTVYRNYNAGKRAKITSKQVARLYYNREISIGYNSSSLNAENSDVSAIRENTIELIESTFSEDEYFCEKIKNMITDSHIVEYYRNSNLIKIDNQPIALNFIEIMIKEDAAFLDILYEEKTKTIIYFSYDFLGVMNDNENNVELFSEKLELAVKDYYENQLGLNEGNCYYIFEIQNIPENKTDSIYDNSYIQFGISQFDAETDKIEKEEMIYYN